MRISLSSKKRLLLILALMGPLALVGARLGLVPRGVIAVIQSFATSPGPGMLADERYLLRFEARVELEDGSIQSVTYHDLLEGRLRTHVLLEVHMRHFLKETKRHGDAQLKEGVRYFFCGRQDSWGWPARIRKVRIRIFSIKGDFVRFAEVSCAE